MKTKRKLAFRVAPRLVLVAALLALSAAAQAGRYYGDVWTDGDRWYYGIVDNDCNTVGNCREPKGYTTSKKEAKKEAKKAAKKANKEDKDGFMDDGRDNGQCSEPGVRC